MAGLYKTSRILILIINSNTMKTLKFKTNINCGGCVSKVTPFLDKQEGVDAWKVDTNNADKILTIESNGATEDEVKATLQKIGFKAESIILN